MTDCFFAEGAYCFWVDFVARITRPSPRFDDEVLPPDVEIAQYEDWERWLRVKYPTLRAEDFERPTRPRTSGLTCAELYYDRTREQVGLPPHPDAWAEIDWLRPRPRNERR